MRKIFQYNNKPLYFQENDIIRSLLNYNMLRQIDKIKYIISNEHTGVHVVSGQRGVGKTSLLNLALSPQKVDYIIKINVLNKDINLIAELLLEFEKYYSENPVLNNNGVRVLTDRDYRKLLDLKELIIFDTEKIHRTINNYKEVESELERSQDSISGDIRSNLNLFRLITGMVNVKSEKAIEMKTSGERFKENEYYIVRKEMQRYETYKSQFIQWSNDISKTKKFVIVLDELDKLSSNDFDYFLEKNKQLFLESNLQIFLVCDQKKYLNLRDPIKINYYDSYISSYIYIPSLDFQSFVPIYFKINMHCRIKSALSNYYRTAGNIRALINHSLMNYIDEEDDWKYGYILYKLEEMDFYRRLDQVYQEVIKSFVVMTLKELHIHQKIDMLFIEELQKTYLEYYNYSITISRLLETTIQELMKIDEVYDESKNMFFLRFQETYFEEENTYINNVTDYFNQMMGQRVNYRNELIIIERELQSNGDGIEVLKIYKDLILGVILYSDGHDDYHTFLNAVIVINNGLFLIGIDYSGYPGISSHKPRYYESFIQYLKNERIKFKDVRDKKVGNERAKFFKNAINELV